MEETYYYVQIGNNYNFLRAYGNMTKRELLHTIKFFERDVKNDYFYTTLFGKTKDIYKLGDFGKRIKGAMIPYKADVMQLVTNTTAYYIEHPDELEVDE